MKARSALDLVTVVLAGSLAGFYLYDRFIQLPRDSFKLAWGWLNLILKLQRPRIHQQPRLGQHLTEILSELGKSP